MSRNLNILLLEDNETDVELFKRALYDAADAPFAIKHVRKLEEAILVLDQFDVIVADLNLPDTTGYLTISSIYTTNPLIPIVAMTSGCSLETAREVISHGAHECLIKGEDKPERLYRSIVSAVIRKIMEKKLIEASENKSNFLANMSHEVRTPLSAILGLTDVLFNSCIDTEQRKYLDVIRSAGSSLLNLLNDVLDLSKVEAGKVDVKKTKFNLILLAQSCIDLFQAKILGDNVRFSLEVAKETPKYVVGDPDRLRQVLSNLLGNAVKFTEKGTIELKISFDKDSNNFYFSVEDSGRGISHENLNRMFLPYEQETVNSSNNFTGTGLGLMICKKLVELLGGVIKVQSTPGKGSCFYFEIPLEPVASQEESMSDQVESLNDLTGKFILIAEDIKENQVVLKAFLKGVGVELDFVDNGAKALEKFNLNKYDLIVLDINMPVLDGCEVARRIRIIEKEKQLKSTRLIALTAGVTDKEKHIVQKSGFDMFLTKPIFMQEFRNALHSALQLN